MSFSRESKEEILKTQIEDDNCAIAFLSGLFHSCGQISKKGNKIYIKIVSDVEKLSDFCQNIVKKLYGDKVEIEVGENYSINKNTYYETAFEVDKFKQLLVDASVIDIVDGRVSFDVGLDKNLFTEDEQRRSFIKGVYIGCSTSSIKLSSDSAQSCGSGYHMEFSSQSHEFLIEFSSILAEYNIIGKIFDTLFNRQ